MKLFKKLAAAVLVAALALMMVGCGSKTVLARQVKNAVSDFAAAVYREQVTESKDLDALAAKLLTEYDNAIAASEEGEQPDLEELLRELLDDEKFLQKVGIDPEKDAYLVSWEPVPSYLSDTRNMEKPFVLAQELLRWDYAIGEHEVGSKYEFGLAIGTLDGEDYALMIVK